jgi:thiamine-monophosphate kinase
MTDGARPSEFALIAQLFAPLATTPGAYGLTDDAATVAPAPGHELVVTADALVEGVHFLKDDPPDAIARKSLRVNLSDLAAKGAQPLGYLLVLSLPSSVSFDWIMSFASGLALDQKEFGISLLGGDTTATPGPLTIAITAFGQTQAGAMIKRSGAKQGDLVYVTGTIGDAGAGLALLRGEKDGFTGLDRDHLVSRYRLPQPRVDFGRALRGTATAALDVSDGLIADLGHIAAASNVRILIDAPSLPLSTSFKALWGRDVVRAATAGDDYEIAFTVPPAAASGLQMASAKYRLSINRIGRVERGAGVVLLDADRQEIAVPKSGFTHF